jgi:outer membrane scaffolding protein for murein synthesis (MipA/OmpV family)
MTFHNSTTPSVRAGAGSRFSSLLVLCASLVIPALANAQDSEEVALPLWEVGLIGGALSTPAYPASNQRNQRALALPFFVYRGEVLRADRNGLGARLLHTDRVEFDIGFAASLPASSNDVELRQGMPDLGTLIEFGPRVKIKLAEPAPDQRVTFELPLRAVLEFNAGVRQVGYALEPKLAYEWQQRGDWRLKGAFSLLLGDQQLNRYFYDVPNVYATANRPAYEAQPGLIGSRIGIDGIKRLGPDVNLFAFAHYDWHDGASNRASPLFAQSQGSSIGLALTWTLSRSEARAETGAR